MVRRGVPEKQPLEDEVVLLEAEPFLSNEAEHICDARQELHRRLCTPATTCSRTGGGEEADSFDAILDGVVQGDGLVRRVLN